MKRHLNTGSALTLGVMIAGGAVCGVASSQDSAVAEPRNEYDSIVVSATKREESIQDVPVSVAAVSAGTIGKLGTSDISDLAVYLPNFEINNATILPNLYVRGLGSGATHSIEQSVGRFVDEVYIGRGAMNLHGFFDVAGVEVLRGPQGTLFGKNTVGGALIVRTAEPTDTFDAGSTLTYGDYSTTGSYTELQSFVSGPITDSLRGRVAVRYRNDDGYYINALDGPDGTEREDEGIRFKLAWDATPNTEVGLNISYQRFEEDGSDAAEINFVGGPPFLRGNYEAIAPGFNTDLDWVTYVDCSDLTVAEDVAAGPTVVAQAGQNLGAFCPSRDQETWSGVARVDHEIPGMGTLTSLSAWQEYNFDHRFNGVDMGLSGSFRASRLEEYSSFTQELRFTSDLLYDRFDFIAGLYYENSEISRNQFSDVNFVTTGLGPVLLRRNEPWTQDTETIAAFGQVRYNVTDQLRLIAGGRFANETKDFAFDRFYNAHQQPGVPLQDGFPLGPFDAPLTNPAIADRSEDKFTPSVTAQFDLTSDIMVFGTYAQGHKTGGFSDRIDSDEAVEAVAFEYDRETNDTFELGTKATLFGGAVNANLTLYTMSIEGLQLATQVGTEVPAFSVDNAAEITSRGLEADAVWFVTPSWTAGADYSYTDATYDDFTGTPECPDSARNVNGDCDLSGFPLIFAPKHKATAFLEYLGQDAFGDWDFGARADVSYSDEYFTDIAYNADISLEDGYTLVNGSLRLYSPDDRWVVSLIGKNLTEEEILQWGIPSGPNGLASMRAPREIALRVSARLN